MKTNQTRHSSGQAIVMLIIILAILGGGYWWLVHSRNTSEKEARDFAHMAAEKLAVEQDQRFLDKYMGSEAQLKFPPSFRGRIMSWLRELGVASEKIEVTGDVTYTNQFFQPVGMFRARLLYPNRYADLDLEVSSPNGWWQIDSVNLVYGPTPTPAPTPIADAGMTSPVPSPSPQP